MQVEETTNRSGSSCGVDRRRVWERRRDLDVRRSVYPRRCTGFLYAVSLAGLEHIRA